MRNKRRNRGPEHIRDIIRSAQKEWRNSITDATRNSERFKEIESTCPGYLQIVFLYIDGDPQYIRTINLN